MKFNRHSKILELIKEHNIETQEELASMLANCGFEVTQATISRDIKDLRLIKVMHEEEKYKYSQMETPSHTLSDKLLTIFAQAYVSGDFALNIAVVKTLSGMASAVAESIDSLHFSDVLGSIAGDNTIFIACRSEQSAKNLIEKFNVIVEDSSK